MPCFSGIVAMVICWNICHVKVNEEAQIHGKMGNLSPVGFGNNLYTDFVSLLADLEHP